MTMPNFIAPTARPIFEVFGHRIREQLLAHLRRASSCASLASAASMSSDDVAADVHVAARVEAERVQRAADGLALRIENARAGNDVNGDAKEPVTVLISSARERWIAASGLSPRGQ